MASLFRILRFLAPLALVAGMVLHATVRDRWLGYATIFYALPLPIITLGWLGWAGTVGFNKPLALLGGLMALGSGFWWRAESFRPTVATPPMPAEAARLDVLFWNLYHSKLPHEDLARLLMQVKPAFAGFVEVGRGSGDPHPLVDPLPTGYQAIKSPHGTALIVRGTASIKRVLMLPSGSKFVEFEALVDGQTWHIFVVDGVSSPLRSRRDVLTEVLASAKDLPRTLIMGDFNTPRQSAYFDAWSEAFYHAYDVAGGGWSETWPSLFPVLSIDHLWVSKDLVPVRASKLWSSSSDHAALSVTLEGPLPLHQPTR